MSSGPRSSPRDGLPAVVAATTAWGASSACLAALGGSGTSAAVVAAGAATTLWAVALGRGDRPFAAFLASPRDLLRVGALEALNLGLYMVALRLGPLPLMVALHLTAPIMLVIWTVLRRQRRASWWLALEFGLLITAIVLISRRSDLGAERTDVLLGGACALASAAVLAVLISSVAESAKSRPPDVSAALQLTVAAALLAPFQLAGPVPAADTYAALFATGATLLAAGFALYWRGLRSVPAPAAGILGLNEALVASVVSAIAFGERFAGTTLLASTLVLAAIAIELRRG